MDGSQHGRVKTCADEHRIPRGLCQGSDEITLGECSAPAVTTTAAFRRGFEHPAGAIRAVWTIPSHTYSTPTAAWESPPPGESCTCETARTGITRSMGPELARVPLEGGFIRRLSDEGWYFRRVCAAYSLWLPSSFRRPEWTHYRRRHERRWNPLSFGIGISDPGEQ